MAPRQVVGPSLYRIEYENRFYHKHMANWVEVGSREQQRSMLYRSGQNGDLSGPREAPRMTWQFLLARGQAIRYR